LVPLWTLSSDEESEAVVVMEEEEEEEEEEEYTAKKLCVCRCPYSRKNAGLGFCSALGTSVYLPTPAPGSLPFCRNSTSTKKMASPAGLSFAFV
jgi:hypothetical protein